MAAISFKFRPAGFTAQLVRHRYDKGIKRSRAVPVGTLDRRADPDTLPKGIDLHAGNELSTAELAAIREWLLVHGDPVAMEERAERERRIEARVRAELESAARVDLDPFTSAVQALHRLRDELPGLVAAAAETPDATGKGIRPRYLEVLKAWGAVFDAAKAHGVAVTRSARSHQDEA